jgi:hypothetical protein
VTLWVVKAGVAASGEERFQARSVIGIGWREVGDLSLYPDRDALRAAYRGSHPEQAGWSPAPGSLALAGLRHRMIGDPVSFVPGTANDRDR